MAHKTEPLSNSTTPFFENYAKFAKKGYVVSEKLGYICRPTRGSLCFFPCRYMYHYYRIRPLERHPFFIMCCDLELDNVHEVHAVTVVGPMLDNLPENVSFTNSPVSVHTLLLPCSIVITRQIYLYWIV